MARVEELQFAVQRAMAEIFLREVRQRVPSRTIRDSLELRYQNDDALVRTPYYWAIFLHEGRPAIRLEAGRFMVFFRNPSEDPRLSGGRPVRRSDVHRLALDRGTFRALMKTGDIIVTRTARAQTGSFFFPRAAAVLPAQTAGAVKRELDIATRDFFAKLPRLEGVTTIRP